MEYLSEDPTPLAGLLLLIAGGFLVATRATQQGKYLVRAAIAGALAVAVVAVEWLWVTDNERIEQAVYGLRDAVAASDVDAVLDYMTPDVMYVKGDIALEGEATRDLISGNLSRVRFDLVRVTNLRTNAAQQSRRGTATFGAFFKGTADSSATIGSFNSIWSLGFQETGPGVWKINRITPVQVPGDGLYVPGVRRMPAMSGPAGGETWSRKSVRRYRP